MHIGVPAEIYPGETRVAATPETVKKLVAGGRHQVSVQAGAGLGAYFLQGIDNGHDSGPSAKKLGGSLFGGAEFFTSKTFSVKAEGRYHVVSKWNGYDPSGLALTVVSPGRLVPSVKFFALMTVGAATPSIFQGVPAPGLSTLRTLTRLSPK